MNYSEAKQYLFEATQLGSVYGLDSIRELLARLDDPQDRLKFIHIAGTNGKGSVLSFLRNILREAGYRAGSFTSPALRSWREIVQVDGQDIGKPAAASCLARIKAAADTMQAQGHAHPTRFEMEVAMAFLYYVQAGCDIVLLEAGLGGQDDATNAVQTSIMEIVTSIGLDHTALLGNTPEAIARQKAGIIKPSTAVVSIAQDDEVTNVLREACVRTGSRLTLADAGRIRLKESSLAMQCFDYSSAGGNAYEDLEIRLAGEHQLENAAIAVEATEQMAGLGFPVTEHQLREGLKRAQWWGRFTVLQDRPMLIIDGAHNPQAAKRLAENIKKNLPGRRIVYIMGVFRDKDVDGILRETAALAGAVIAVDIPENERLMDAQELAGIIKKYNDHVQCARDMSEAWRLAQEQAGDDAAIVAFGSLSFLDGLAKTAGKGNR